jgi:hypothetical protein
MVPCIAVTCCAIWLWLVSVAAAVDDVVVFSVVFVLLRCCVVVRCCVSVLLCSSHEIRSHCAHRLFIPAVGALQSIAARAQGLTRCSHVGL